MTEMPRTTAGYVTDLEEIILGMETGRMVDVPKLWGVSYAPDPDSSDHEIRTYRLEVAVRHLVPESRRPKHPYAGRRAQVCLLGSPFGTWYIRTRVRDDGSLRLDIPAGTTLRGANIRLWSWRKLRWVPWINHSARQPEMFAHPGEYLIMPRLDVMARNEDGSNIENEPEIDLEADLDRVRAAARTYLDELSDDPDSPETVRTLRALRTALEET